MGSGRGTLLREFANASSTCRDPGWAALTGCGTVAFLMELEIAVLLHLRWLQPLTKTRVSPEPARA